MIRSMVICTAVFIALLSSCTADHSKTSTILSASQISELPSPTAAQTSSAPLGSLETEARSVAEDSIDPSGALELGGLMQFSLDDRGLQARAMHPSPENNWRDNRDMDNLFWPKSPAERRSDRQTEHRILRDSTFQAAQWSVTTRAALALNRFAAQARSRSDRIGMLEQRKIEVNRRIMDLSTLLAQLQSSSDDTTIETSQIVTQLSVLYEQLSDLDVQIQSADPAYFELTRQEAYSLRDIQSLLEIDEALLYFLVSEDATYIFCLTSREAVWLRQTAASLSTLAADIAALRAQAQDDVFYSESSFNTRVANSIYNNLFAPMEGVIGSSKRIFVINTGPLLAFPTQALVVSEAIEGSYTSNEEKLAKTVWVADRYAVVILPAVSSLVALRCLISDRHAHLTCPRQTATTARPRPIHRTSSIEFFGIGDPLLTDVTPFPSSSLTIGPSRGVTPVDDDAIIDTITGLADTEFLRSLPNLEGARKELESVSALFPRDSSVTLLRQDASERAIKSAAALSDASYVLISTHGLLASESDAVAQPGLVFTPPDRSKSSQTDDGLLTATEISGMRLSAKFVVLSACNTAASDGSLRGEGLSGLTRAFFYAGAQSVLASHWNVSDDATFLLVSSMFTEARNKPNAAKADVFQEAMSRVRSQPGWASPGFWAAFSLIGEGGN